MILGLQRHLNHLAAKRVTRSWQKGNTFAAIETQLYVISRETGPGQRAIETAPPLGSVLLR